MKRFVEGADRVQSTLLPECLDDWIDEEKPIRAVDAFVDALDLKELGFDGVERAATGRPAFHPSVLLKLYIYDYLNRVQSSRRLERESGRNLEVLWLLGRLIPDHKTIADFRKDNAAVRKVCARFVDLCRQMGLLSVASVAIDGSKVVLAKPSSAWTLSTTATATSRRASDVALSGWCKSSPKEVTTFEAEGNCVAAMRGGEQPEANEQPAG